MAGTGMDTAVVGVSGAIPKPHAKKHSQRRWPRRMPHMVTQPLRKNVDGTGMDADVNVIGIRSRT
jgi:hypothetical protein